MIHVLEHIVDPAKYLRKLSSLLSSNGLLLIQVPNLNRNPYDLAVFDHCSHFTATSLKALLAQAGLHIKWLSEDIVSKELTVLCSIGISKPILIAPKDLRIAEDSVLWLQNFKHKFMAIEYKFNLGIFGTSIGASWVVSELGYSPDFFLDEDINRIGKYHLDKPILAPIDAMQGAVIIIPLTIESAAAVSTRITRPDLIFFYPS